jgi:hypothetical protein
VLQNCDSHIDEHYNETIKQSKPYKKQDELFLLEY